jgi:hypothetical protein
VVLGLAACVLAVLASASVSVAFADGCTTAAHVTTCISPVGNPGGAVPSISIASPTGRDSYERGSRVRAHYSCSEVGGPVAIATCGGTVANGRTISTRSVGVQSFTVTATDSDGNRVTKTVRYRVWAYINPVRAVRNLVTGRVDMGVDYGGSGPILALGAGRVTVASDTDSGPASCWGRTCWPAGGIVVYRLADGPFAGKYVYVAENITVSVRAGQTVRAGQRIATLHPEFPDMETGWASGEGPETLAIARGHQCTCGDPGGWSSIEGRNFDRLLISVHGPSGYLQPNLPNQSMPAHWPAFRSIAHRALIPQARRPLSEGAARSSTPDRPRAGGLTRPATLVASVVSTVGVAQLVELRVVVPAVVGSSPIAHPSGKTWKSGHLHRALQTGRGPPGYQ